MNSVQNILSNQWIIGIGTTVISAVIISLATKWITRKNQNKRYMLANREIMDSLRPLYLMVEIPSSITIAAVISSIAREFSFDIRALNSPENVREDIFREIISNNFLNSDIKKSFIEQYEGAIIESSQKSLELAEEMYTLRDSSIKTEYRRNLVIIYSLLGILLLVSMGIGSIISLINPDFGKKFFSVSLSDYEIILFLIMGLSSLIVLFFAFLYKKWKLKTYKNNKE